MLLPGINRYVAISLFIALLVSIVLICLYNVNPNFTGAGIMALIFTLGVFVSLLITKFRPIAGSNEVFVGHDGKPYEHNIIIPIKTNERDPSETFRELTNNIHNKDLQPLIESNRHKKIVTIGSNHFQPVKISGSENLCLYRSLVAGLALTKPKLANELNNNSEQLKVIVLQGLDKRVELAKTDDERMALELARDEIKPSGAMGSGAVIGEFAEIFGVNVVLVNRNEKLGSAVFKSNSSTANTPTIYIYFGNAHYDLLLPVSVKSKADSVAAL